MSNYGKEVWSKQYLVPSKGSRAEQICQELERLVVSKGIPDLQVQKGPIGLWGKEYQIFQRKVGLGASAAMAVSLESQGVDLAVQLRQFEISPLGTGGNVLKLYLALGFIGAGILTLALAGAGAILIIIGIILWPRGVQATLSGDQKSKSEFLYEAVNQALDKALESRE